jgi:phytoene dehydrogenase-like protein
MSYDVITVGSGHNALIAAAYLAVAGRKVLVLEKNAWFGGGVVTRAVTAPGFRHDTHSTTHLFIHANPLLQNDELGLKSKFGLRYITPEAAFATIFSDGRAIVTYRDLEKTIQSIAQFSPPDAAAYRKLVAQSMHLLPMFVKGMFVPPVSNAALTALLEQSAEGRELITVMTRSVYDVVNDWFENEQVKVHFMRFTAESGTMPEEKNTGLLLYLVPGFLHGYPTSLPEGGSGELTAALIRCIEHHGGTLRAESAVTRVNVRNGRATGVTLANREKLDARELVIGSIHPRLLGELVEGFPADLAGRARKLQPGGFSAINTHYALREAPKFLTASPDAARAVSMQLISPDLDELRRMFDGYRYGRLHDGTIQAGGTLTVNVHTNHDPSRAPAGHATLYLYSFVPYALADGGAARWDTIKEEVADQMLASFRRFTSNMGSENIISRYVESPLDMERSSASFQHGDTHGLGSYAHQHGSFRPLPELAQYTVPGIERFYLAGPFMHPGGGVFGGGRATAVRIFDDLGLDLEKVTAKYVAGRLA